MLIKDLIETNVVKVDKHTTWFETLELMEKHDTNGIFVVDGHDKYLGAVTIADLINFVVPPYMKENPDLAKSAGPGTFFELCQAKKDVKVEKFMDKRRAFFRPNISLTEVVAASLGTDSYRIPVVDKEGKLIGVVNRRHIREALGQRFKNQP